MTAKVPAEDQLGTLKDLQQQGKIKHIGLSEVSIAQIEHAREIVPIVSVQNRYSVTERGAEDVLDYCERAHIGFIPWFPLASGKLSSSGSVLARSAAELKITTSQLALAWLLWRSPVILPILERLASSTWKRMSPQPHSNLATRNCGRSANRRAPHNL